MGSGRGDMSGCLRQGSLPGLGHPEAEEDKGCLLSAWLSGGAAAAGGGSGGGSGAGPSQLVARAPLDSASARHLFPASARTGRRVRGRGRARMEESHFNSSPYFWPAVPTVSGQIDNSMFINKMKEQLLPAEKGCGLAPPHYPALLTVPTSVALPTSISMESDTKPEQLTPHSQAPVTQNITVVPVQSAGLMSTGPGLVITSPSGSLVTTASSVQTFPISAPMIVSALPPGSQATLQVVPDLSKKGGVALSEGGAVSITGGITPKAPRGRKKKRLQESGLPEMSDPFVLSNEDDDDQHKDGKTYRCRMCSLTFYSKSEMQIHSKSHTEAKPHKCPHCSKSFANSSYLAQHLRIHSGAKPYTCSYCQKAFRQLSHLQQHTRIHSKLHTAIVKPHKCPHCSKSFANTSYLAQHLRIHSGVKPYTCRYCQKAFRQLSHLQQHTRIHTGDRPYKCAHPGCEKAFTQLSNLQSHRRQHNKDKPFKCHNCHRAYTDAASLEVHLATHTVKHAKIYNCSMCNRAYTSETYLMKHMRKHNIPDPQQQVAQVQAQVQAQVKAPPSPFWYLMRSEGWLTDGRDFNFGWLLSTEGTQQGDS